MKNILRRLVPAVLMLTLGASCVVYDDYPHRGYDHRQDHSSHRGGYSSYRNGHSGYRGGYHH